MDGKTLHTKGAGEDPSLHPSLSPPSMGSSHSGGCCSKPPVDIHAVGTFFSPFRALLFLLSAGPEWEETGPTGPQRLSNELVSPNLTTASSMVSPLLHQNPFVLDLGDSEHLGTEDKHQKQVLQAGDRGENKQADQRSMLRQTWVRILAVRPWKVL